MTLKLCCKNDFVEQITIIYWLFYALLNNQQFMKTTRHKYGRRFLRPSGFAATENRLIPHSPLSSLAVCPALGLGSQVASHPGMSSGT